MLYGPCCLSAHWYLPITDFPENLTITTKPASLSHSMVLMWDVIFAWYLSLTRVQTYTLAVASHLAFASHLDKQLLIYI